MRRALLVGLVLFVAACPEPRQGDAPIPVSPGASARIARMQKAPPPPRANGAKAHPLAKGQELGGPNATGKPGDWVLENTEVVFVIEGLGGGSGFAESGGNIIDAADARVRKDELGQLFTYFGTFPRQAVYTQIEGQDAPNGAAVVVARGKELYEPTLAVETRYQLGAGDRAVLLATTVTNTGTAPQKLGLGDAVQWGGAEKLAPGKAVGFTGRSSGPFLGGIGRFASYALTSTEGQLDAINGSVWSDTEQVKDVTLDPGKSVTYQRVFLVGERPDAASIVAELTRASGGDVGAVEIALVGADSGEPVQATPGAKVIVSTPSGNEVMSFVAPNGGKTFGGDIPPGRWRLAYAPSGGRRGDGKTVDVEVKKGESAHATFAVSRVGAIEPSCDVPCKVTVEGTNGTPTPILGPPHAAPYAKNQILAATPTGQGIIPPGSYRLTFSRGPEYETATADVTIEPSGLARPHVTLKRVVDTKGYVATDFHQHSMLSADAPVSVDDRVRANVVEGVEVAVATEHNFVADFAPAVKALGLSAHVVAIPGDEITTDADKNAWGHANVFPLVPQPGKPRAGAFLFMGRSPKEVFDEARRLPEHPLVQINHPRSGINGYFDRTGFDRQTGVGTRAGYDAAFDSVEVWNGRNVEARDKTLEDFLALLRTGHPVTPIGDTDTHGIVGHEAGYPRTMVRVDKDDALDAWDAARTQDLVKGVRERRDVVITNGPMIRVDANGAGIGGIAKGKVVKVVVRVQSASFAPVEKVAIRVASDGRTEEKAPDAKGEATFTLRAAKDDAFVVIAKGTKPMRPILSGDDKEIAPWAMTGAIWIDADGDGKSLGR